MANCEGEIISCDKNVINTFAHQHLKYDENEKYYIISLENFFYFLAKYYVYKIK